MKVKFDQTTGMVSWKTDDKDISMHFPNLFCAFEHGDQLIMVKEKDKNLKVSYSVYSIKGEFILSYNYLDNKVRFKSKVISLDNRQIIDADFDKKRNVLILLIKSDERELILLYDSNGEYISYIPSPHDFRFMYLSNDEGTVTVVAHGLQEKSADEFGRNDWIFLINVDNYYVEKDSIIQL